MCGTLLDQRIPDLDALAARLHRKSASLLDLVRMYALVKLLPVVVEKLQVRPAFHGTVAAAGASITPVCGSCVIDRLTRRRMLRC